MRRRRGVPGAHRRLRAGATVSHKVMNLHLTPAVAMAVAVACGHVETEQGAATTAHRPRSSHRAPDADGNRADGGATSSRGAAGASALGARASGGSSAMRGAAGARGVSRDAGAGTAAGGADAGWQTKLGELTTPDQARVICDRIAAEVDTLKWSD